MRLLEVNGTNVIGVTRQEAIEAFRRAGHILRLLVCDGWNDDKQVTAANGPSAGGRQQQPDNTMSSSTPSLISSAIAKLDRRGSRPVSPKPQLIL